MSGHSHVRRPPRRASPLWRRLLGPLRSLGHADQSSLDGAAPGTAWSSLEGTASRIPIESGIGWAAVGAGAACGALGAVLLATSGGGAASAETTRVTLGPLGVRVEGTF